jgi:hypothetical protein
MTRDAAAPAIDRFARGAKVLIHWQHPENTGTVYHDGSGETVVVTTDQTGALIQLPRHQLSSR